MKPLPTVFSMKGSTVLDLQLGSNIRALPVSARGVQSKLPSLHCKFSLGTRLGACRFTDLDVEIGKFACFKDRRNAKKGLCREK